MSCKYTILLLFSVLNYKRLSLDDPRADPDPNHDHQTNFFSDNYDISQTESNPTLKLFKHKMSEILQDQVDVSFFSFCRNPQKMIKAKK